MRVVTTCHKEGFDTYGQACLESWRNWPESAELRWYTEDFAIPDTPRVTAVPLSKIKALHTFKRRYADYKAPSFLFDVVRYSNKVFAAIDALREWKGVGVWLDADCVTHREIPEGLIESYLPEGAYMAIYARPGMYTETGFWLMNCAHQAHKDFLQTWSDWYTTDAFKQLTNWTDCETLDATIRKFVKEGRIKVADLTPQNIADTHTHPQAQSELGRYVDHRKGPRKKAANSPENKFVGEPVPQYVARPNGAALERARPGDEVY